MKNGSTLQEFAERKDSMILKGLYTTLINSDTQYAHTQTNKCRKKGTVTNGLCQPLNICEKLGLIVVQHH